MEKIITTPPSGTRDFFGQELKTKEYIFETIKKSFKNFGFEPLETPALERIEILSGKYGDEGESLLFKILKRGEKATSGEVDLALRYDLTVPLARVVAEYRDRLPMPYKRYQIAPVWRADRPGKDRFREFYQSDVDIVGSDSVMADSEIVLVLSETLYALGISDFEIQINSRNVLSGILDYYKVPVKQRTATLTAIDKLDKIGSDGVKKELLKNGLPKSLTDAVISDITSVDSENVIKRNLKDSSVGQDGVEEVEKIIKSVSPLIKSTIRFSPSLARGLSYYTGPIFEIVTKKSKSSIAGGGRYDNLIRMFTGKKIVACGGSLGLERIIPLLHITPTVQKKVFVSVWNTILRVDSLKIASELRSNNVCTEVYIGEKNIKKQLQEAIKKDFDCFIVIGPDEKKKSEVSIKNLRTREQHSVPIDDVAKFVTSQLSD